jgi:hypothetical protein
MYKNKSNMNRLEHTVNGCSFDRFMGLFKGKRLVEKVSKEVKPGFKEVLKDYNKTDMPQI